MNVRRLLWLVLLLPACVGTDTGNPPLSASLSARSSDPAVVISPAAGEVVVGGAWISLSEVRLTLGERCDHLSEPYAVDVVGDLVVGLPTAGIPETSICGVHVDLHAPSELPAGAPDALADRTLLLVGRLADGRPFEISSALTRGINVSGPAPFSLDEGAGAMIVFDVSRWVAGLDLAGLLPDADGVVRLGPGDAELEIFENGAVGGVELYADVDGDGVLDPSELSAGALASSHAP